MEIDPQKQREKMLNTPVPRLVTSLAIPTVISQMVTTIYNTADTYFVAQIGTSAAAAVGVVFSLMSLMQAWGMGLGMGANSLVSRKLGAAKNEEANLYASSAIAASFLGGCVILLLGMIFLKPLMRLLGSTETMLPFSMAYARIILMGAPFMCWAFTMNSILRSEGEAAFAMWGLCSGGILNMVLDPIFIFGLHMGIAGAALATVLSQLVSFCILLSVFVRGKSIVKLAPRWISHRPADYWLIITTGAPTFCRQGLASLASALMNIKAAPFGDAAVAAVTIANKIYLMVRNIILGIGQGMQPVIGYNFGAGERGRVRETFRFATLLGTVISIAAAIPLALNAAAVIAWFRADDPEVIAIGTRALYFVCSVLPFLAYSTYVNQTYQVMGYRVPATVLACCRQGICFIPLAIVLPSLLGLTGVEMLQPAADLASFIVAVPFQVHMYRVLLAPQGDKEKRLNGATRK
ncbi:MAG: MATE family efflux transporter [Lachnospiraceae bacterium]|nr:MATE family efflux transporter [Lachnospiraceae bacterium]